MAEVWKSQTKEILEYWKDAIFDEAEERLSEWERNFMECIAHRLSDNFSLSQKQQETLEKIYAKYTK